MSNRLKPVKVDAIRLLWERGWSRRRIARELGIDRGTVCGYVRHWQAAGSADPPRGCDAKPAKLHPGPAANPANVHPGSIEASPAEPASEHPGTVVPSESKIQAESNPASEHPGSSGPSGEQSLCWPHRTLIQSKLDQGLSAQRIYQDLRSEQGFAGCYHSVRRFVRRLQPRQTLPFRRMEVGPGDEVQVDFGQGAWIVDGLGKKHRPHLFRMVLNHSRKAYSEVVARQTADAFLQCLENAFHYFASTAPPPTAQQHFEVAERAALLPLPEQRFPNY